MPKPLSDRQKLALTWLALGLIALLFIASGYLEGTPHIVGVLVLTAAAIGCLIWPLKGN